MLRVIYLISKRHLTGNKRVFYISFSSLQEVLKFSYLICIFPKRFSKPTGFGPWEMTYMFQICTCIFILFFLFLYIKVTLNFSQLFTGNREMCHITKTACFIPICCTSWTWTHNFLYFLGICTLYCPKTFTWTLSHAETST